MSAAVPAPMAGLMMDRPLLLKTLLWRAERVFGSQEIVTAIPGGSHRYTYADHAGRARRLAAALAELGVERGRRVGTLAWNHWRHFEAYFAVPCMGAVLHTTNLRLSPEHVAFTINRAGDEVLLVDVDQLGLLEEIWPALTSVRAVVVLGDHGAGVGLDSRVPILSYEQLLAEADPDFEFPELDENAAAAICFTSATTGDPKGVVYSQRSMVLHTIMQATHGSFGVHERMSLLGISPMFHANSWGLPHAAAMQGAKLVLPGARPTPGVYLDLIARERVTHAYAAVTVGVQMLEALEADPGAYDLSSLEVLLLGGQMAPRSLMEFFDRRGVHVAQGWGMTEASPFASWNDARARSRLDDADAIYADRQLQGTPLPLMEVKLVDDRGRSLAWDGQATGEFLLRAPWVARAYLDDPDRSRDAIVDGWYRTGDVGVIEPDGRIHLVDRAKDLIKSGGEWISSVELESALMTHKKVSEAAVIAVPDERWVERPLAYVTSRRAADPPTAAELTEFLGPRFPRWWLPDRFEFVAQIPKTGVGKYDKKALRARHARTAGESGD